jgi:surface antigen
MEARAQMRSPAQLETPSITYTPSPGWTNAQGQYCREYKSNQAAGRRATERYGTACRDASGQWRMVN